MRPSDACFERFVLPSLKGEAAASIKRAPRKLQEEWKLPVHMGKTALCNIALNPAKRYIYRERR
jgi:hypothetical protein